MNVQALETVLAQTLTDSRLSGGGEKRLGSVLANLELDEQQLAFLRHSRPSSWPATPWRSDLR